MVVAERTPDLTEANRPRAHLTLATKVTLLRLLGIPFFVLAMMYYRISLAEGQPDPRFRAAALAIFLVIALTDALDGFLARSRGEITRLGRILDPLADKSLLLSAILMLTAPSLPALRPQLPMWFSLTAISRDLLLAIGAFVVHHQTGHLEIRPRLTGKIGTALQMATAVWVLAAGPARPLRALAVSAIAFIVASAVQYVVDGWRQIAAPPVLPSAN